MNKIHIPVLLQESIDSLNIQPDGFYIDCTLGDGGHSSQILSQLSSSGLLVSTDHDKHAIEFVEEFYEIPSNWKLLNTNFSKISEKLKEAGIERKPNGILMDLGLSSRQLEESYNRGFSYQEENEPLDMRMDEELGVTALDLLRVFNDKELAKLFTEYGEEKFAWSIARKIKKNISKISTVGDLTRLIYGAVPAAPNHKHPARRVFQALRIAVNDELNSLETGLDKSFEILQPQGRISVITFHSLEDRIVKDFFAKMTDEKHGQLLTEDPVIPTKQELAENPRSSSSKLRTLIKI